MTNSYFSFLFILFFTLSSLRISASPQLPDYIIFKGDTIATYNLILERYFQQQEKSDEGQLFGLHFRDGASFSCWRGYQAIYRVNNDSLFLVNIINCGELGSHKIDKVASAQKMKAIFKDKMVNGRVYINWFSGDINFPLSDKILRWDGVFYTVYEKETVVSICEGKILNIKDVENYVDDPKRINRKDKNNISDILFKKLKKRKWKNNADFDCSEKYLVTINENGNVSTVRMLYSREEIDQYHQAAEYDFCINNMFNALESLKFDIIKDKGRPISEDVYIEIWIEDNGKIKNWTH